MSELSEPQTNTQALILSQKAMRYGVYLEIKRDQQGEWGSDTPAPLILLWYSDDTPNTPQYSNDTPPVLWSIGSIASPPSRPPYA